MRFKGQKMHLTESLLKVYELYVSLLKRGLEMKIIIETDSSAKETEIIIKCQKIDTQIENLIKKLKALDISIKGKKAGNIYNIAPEDIYYIESVENKTYIYAEKEVYESDLKLYEAEELLSTEEFIRSGKSCIFNFNKLRSVKALFNGKYEAHLLNGEVIIVNRHYVPILKEKFDI